MTTAEQKRRDQLAYLALFHAITGNERRSEQIRRVVRKLEGQPAESELMETAKAF